MQYPGWHGHWGALHVAGLADLSTQKKKKKTNPRSLSSNLLQMAGTKELCKVDGGQTGKCDRTKYSTCQKTVDHRGTLYNTW